MGFDKRGQTALEYLLILIIALIVVIAIFIWVNSTQEEAQGQGNEVAEELWNIFRGGTGSTTSCGDGAVQNPNGDGVMEQCDPPAINNPQCPNPADSCVGPKFVVYDGFGDCDSSCQCQQDPAPAGVCESSCGAQCERNDDCSGGSVCRLDTCECDFVPPEEGCECFDDIDNDYDGDTDEDDSGCQCRDGDGAGGDPNLVDCADSACDSEPYCADREYEAIGCGWDPCADSFDNDGDGLIDAADSLDCSPVP
ncbi:MAG: class III signal peptide-containing protein [Candidatus Altiarchaeota archaeon]|nr:class III signal peptide-containing protein [Candidatus Altiarchaeota archaeon]